MNKNIEIANNIVSIEALKEELIERAKNMYGVIYPCQPYNNITESFVLYENILMFWFMDVASDIHMEYLNI